jgi:hypothetical protein
MLEEKVMVVPPNLQVAADASFESSLLFQQMKII